MKKTLTACALALCLAIVPATALAAPATGLGHGCARGAACQIAFGNQLFGGILDQIAPLCALARGAQGGTFAVDADDGAANSARDPQGIRGAVGGQRSGSCYLDENGDGICDRSSDGTCPADGADCPRHGDACPNGACPADGIDCPQHGSDCPNGPCPADGVNCPRHGDACPNAWNAGGGQADGSSRADDADAWNGSGTGHHRGGCGNGNDSGYGYGHGSGHGCRR